MTTTLATKIKPPRIFWEFWSVWQGQSMSTVGTFPYECPLCRSYFSKNLKKHISTHRYVSTYVFQDFPVSELLYELTYTGKALRVNSSSRPLTGLSAHRCGALGFPWPPESSLDPCLRSPGLPAMITKNNRK